MTTLASAPTSSRPAASRRALGPGIVTVLAGLIVLSGVFVLALCVGARSLPVADIWALFTGGQVDDDVRMVVLDLRLPRSVIAVVAGLALGLAGALAQSLTRNPLADTGILGLNSGASFFIAMSVVIFGVSTPALNLPFAYAGTMAVALAVFFIGGTDASRPAIARVTLAGMAIGAVLSGVVLALTLVDPASFSVLQAWNAASLESRSWADLLPALLPVAAGVAIALTLGASFNTLSLGEDLARGLGVNAGRVRILALVAITLLCGSATAIAGPIVFVGLMIPHLARAIVGVDNRWVMVVTMVLSPILLLGADILGRIALPNGEVPVGLVTAFLGAPVLIAIARRQSLVSAP